MARQAIAASIAFEIAIELARAMSRRTSIVLIDADEEFTRRRGGQARRIVNVGGSSEERRLEAGHDFQVADPRSLGRRFLRGNLLRHELGAEHFELIKAGPLAFRELRG